MHIRYAYFIKPAFMGYDQQSKVNNDIEINFLITI